MAPEVFLAKAVRTQPWYPATGIRATRAVLVLAVVILTADRQGGGQQGLFTAPDSRPQSRLLSRADIGSVPAARIVAPIAVNYPTDGALFPPDLAPPTFLWTDPTETATAWRIEIAFAGNGPHIEVWSVGERLRVGELDESLTGFVPPTLSLEQQAEHTWKPDSETWTKIKKHSVRALATVWITGFRGSQTGELVSRGKVTLQTSRDPVGAPIFYRDVPLIPPPADQGERGVIKPLPDSVLPKIKWRLKDVSSSTSKIVMEGLPTCANCHSISTDGKTLGIDVDGPQNDKGLYGLIPIRRVSTISNDYVIRWSAFTENGSPKRFGFMSQVSPDGKYVITSIGVPGTHGTRVVDRLYNGFYDNYGFGQVFFPTRGVLAWYSREIGKLQTLPGADDPDYVQTSAFWSPDGKYLVYSRAKAKDPYAPGQKRATYAYDPNETQIQYDLYRIPFNNGKGGTPERIVGASEDGASNNFPKVSPDGKWIVFVRNKNGLLMGPDSQLYIVPFAGGFARQLGCNQPVMNSWHSFSPNGRWLVFSSKSPSLYTRMYLTHIDSEGKDSPAIAIEDATAANRAVNIPEFMNVAARNLERIDAPATEFYRQFDLAVQFAEKKQFADAVPAWKKAIEMDPVDSRAHNNLGVALIETGQSKDAIAEYRKSLQLNPDSAQTQNNLGSALAESGSLEEAGSHFEKALALDPDNAAAHINLGNSLAAERGHTPEAIEQLRKGLELQPDSADGQNGLGIALARSGNLDEAVVHLERAVSLAPQSAGYRYNLGRVHAAKEEFREALSQFEEAARLSQMQDPSVLEMLAAMYSETGRYSDAIETARRGLGVANDQKNYELAASLKASLSRYSTFAQGGKRD